MTVATTTKKKSKKSTEELTGVEEVNSIVVHASADEQEKVDSVSKGFDENSSVKDVAIAVHASAPEQSAEDSEQTLGGDKPKIQMEFTKLVTGMGSRRSKAALNLNGEVCFRQITSAIVETKRHERVKGGFSTAKAVKKQELDDNGQPVLNDKGKPVFTTKTVVTHYIGGGKATKKNGCILMTDDSSYKKKYNSPIVLAQIVDFGTKILNSISYPKERTRKKTSEKYLDESNRVLPIQWISQNIENGHDLFEDLKLYKWVEFNNVRYYLKWSPGVSTHSESFGAVAWAKYEKNESRSEVIVWDKGGITSQTIEFDCSYSEPMEGESELNGGGGVFSLVERLRKLCTDGQRAIELSFEELSSIVWNSKYLDGKVQASYQGEDLSEKLALAINQWLKGAAGDALKDMTQRGQQFPIYLCGGGFQIESVREVICQRMRSGGVPESNIILCDNPQTIATTYTSKYYANLRTTKK